MKAEDFPALLNDRLLKAARREEVDKTPVWAMRQAGRYLPEFREVRAKNDFFTVCRTPTLACEVTLQPIRRFELDAAIIFSDILVVPQAMGMEVQMVPGKGPVFPQPLRTVEQMASLNMEPDINKELGYVFQAITLTRHELKGKVPLIGFSGAPWTLMAYMIEGSGSPTFKEARRWLLQFPQESHKLLSALTDIIVEYLVGQANAGAQLLQVFDSHAGLMDHEKFREFLLPYLRRIPTEVKMRTNNKVPMTVFAKGAHYAMRDLCETDYDVIGLDWTTDVEEATKIASSKGKALQGNLDPADLYGSPEQVRKATERMMTKYGKLGHIANLGHGMHPDHQPDRLKMFVDTVHECSGK